MVQNQSQIPTWTADQVEGTRPSIEEKEHSASALADGSASRMLENLYGWEAPDHAPGEQRVGTGSAGCDHESGKWNPSFESMSYAHKWLEHTAQYQPV